MAEKQTLLAASAIAKTFKVGGGLFSRARALQAVRGVTFDVSRGSITGIVGESGCGKSTLARLILRLIEPSSGTIRFDGTDITPLGFRDLRRVRRRMQMVFQDPYSSLDPRYTIADVLNEPFLVQGEKAAPGRVAELLDQVGLASPLAQSHAHQLSGGQRQRVGIARALALHPDLLVLDEPTASLDVSIQAQVISLLERLKRELRLTYIFISHDLGLVRYFCDRIIVMYLGAIVEDLPRPEAKPRHPYTRALLDSTFLPDPAQRKTIAVLSGEIPSALNLPKGCAFAPRCPRAMAQCGEAEPGLVAMPDGHRFACFNPIPQA